MKYTIEDRPIGKGATSKVYIGVNEKYEKVAIKRLVKTEAEKEVAFLKSIPTNNHIIGLVDFFLIGSFGYIVMEYHEGTRLGHFKRGNIRNPNLAVQITIAILKGLKIIHENGFLHSDISPHNVLICNDDPQTVKIIDFGSSVRKNDSGIFTGKHKGATKWYRPPEFMKEENNSFSAELNNSSDLYSAACICLYLLNGKAPFRKRQVCKQINNIPLQKVLKKATNPYKHKRYQTAEELIDALLPFA
jgi:serine/threonine protein kinase